MTKNNYYITTTLPYVNSDPHIGFAFELIQADVLARYQKLLGSNVIFNYGTDEHGAKIYEKAIKLSKAKPQECIYIDDIKEYVDVAQNIGINAIHYKSDNYLKNKLKKLLSSCF